MQEDLDRVRALRSSKIPAHTRQVALLNGVESLLEENGDLSATAYFAALLSLLNRSDAVEPATELLAYIVPHVPKPLLASKIDVAVAKLLPVLLEDASTALTRSAIAVLEAILMSVDASAWNIPLSELGAQRTFSGVLALAQDSRPKIRKRAVEAVSNVLKNGLGGQRLAVEAGITAISTASESQKLMHALQLLRTVVQSTEISSRQTDELVELLLKSVRSAEQFAVLTAFEVLTALNPSTETLMAIKPGINDKQLAPAWLALAAQSRLDVFPVVTEYLTSTHSEVVESAGQCLIALISEIMPHDDLAVLRSVADQLFGLLQVRYHSAWPTVCEVCAAFIAVLPRELAPKIDGVLNIVRVIGTLRTSTNEADVVLAAAISVLGPRIVLDVVPLQLDPVTGQGRAWMLPLLTNVQHTELSFYFEVIFPLAVEFEQAAETAEARRAKILTTVADQLLMLFPHFCDECIDQMNVEQLQLILSRLYARTDLRAMICLGLKHIATPQFAKEFGTDILKSLLNVFQSDTRGFILETVDAYFAVLPKEEVAQLFNQVSALLAENLGNAEMSHKMMDIIVHIAPHLTNETETLFNLFKTTATLPDALMQKKAYRCATQLPPQVLGPALLELQAQVLPNARRTRLLAIERVVESLDGNFAFIFRTLPEAILGTRDPNEKTREAAFDLLVLMGQKMSTPGVVDHADIPEINDDLKPEASIVEYFEMIMAGLAADTQHMVAATATALARVLFEFHKQLPPKKLEEYIELVYMLLESPSREIVTSTLGFVKVSVLIMPQEQLLRHLGPLLQLLLAWSNEHKNHFKSKVRHLVERLLRRCGYEALDAVFPESDKKLLHNIHKSKERARRKRSQPQEEGAAAPAVPKRKFDNEFDEALYGSDSEDDEDEHPPASRQPQQSEAGSKKRSEQFILGGSDPLDLLDERALSQISSTRPQAKPQRKMKHELAQTKDGKLVIGRNVEAEKDSAAADAMAAYMDAVRSGPVRGQSGKLKYKRGKNADDSDDEEAIKPNPSKVEKTKKAAKGKKGVKNHMRGRRRL